MLSENLYEARKSVSKFLDSSRKGKAGKKNRNGLYPSLILLGIYEHFSPALASEVSMLSVAMGSLEEARHILEQRGLLLNIKTLRQLTYRFAQLARTALEADIVEFIDHIVGCKVVVSIDGGRLRIRKNQPGPKTKKCRHHYHTDWREPKLLNIYVVDEPGKKVRDFKPFIDGTLKGFDAIFMWLEYYLSKLNIQEVDMLLFVADGAHGIWNRVRNLIQVLQLKSSPVHELVDFYHAVEHLGKIASLRKNWNAVSRNRWLKKHRKLLKQGAIKQVIEAIRAICRGRNRADIKRERDYFIRNQHRMNYNIMTKMNLPLGSGAMESAVRRVINLRLKGPGIFWHEENAEAMLLLRSFDKAGRWDMLKNMVFSEPVPVIV